MSGTDCINKTVDMCAGCTESGGNSEVSCYKPPESPQADSEAVSAELALLADCKLQKLLKIWADKALPDNTNHLEKLKEEFAELLDEPYDPTEMADVLLALMLHAESNGVDLLAAGLSKFRIVIGREYGELNSKGVSRHTDNPDFTPPRYDKVFFDGLEALSKM